MAEKGIARRKRRSSQRDTGTPGRDAATAGTGTGTDDTPIAFEEKEVTLSDASPVSDESAFVVEAQPPKKKRGRKAKSVSESFDSGEYAGRAIHAVEITVTFALSVDGSMNVTEKALVQPGLVKLIEKLEPEALERFSKGVDYSGLILGGLAYASRMVRNKIDQMKRKRAEEEVKQREEKQSAPVNRREQFSEFVT